MAGEESFEFSATYPQHKEAPSGLAPIIVPDSGVNNSRIIAEHYTFTRKPAQEFSG
jgi:hypothetical protein